MTEMITVRNLETGEVGLIRKKWFDSPILNDGILEEVPPGTKPAWPGMWLSKIEPAETPDEEEDD